MSSFIRLIACSVVALLMPFALAAATPEAPTRIALIIANSNYPTAGDSLPGAARDANMLEQTLKDASLGFRVTVARNKGKREIEAALRQFQLDLRQAGPEAIGFLYYVGHGAADGAGSDNYLLPADVEDISTASVAERGISVREVSEKLASLDKRAIIIVVDACRSVGSGGRGGGAGARKSAGRLVEPDEQKPGFLMALSTSQAHAASDSGTYAQALAKNLLAPGLTVDQVFQQVRIEVARSTRQAQIPVERSKIIDNVCLVSCSVASAGGPYSANPQLLDSARSSAEFALAQITKLNASTACEKGWQRLIELRASAEKDLKSSRLDSAGYAYTQIEKIGGEIYEYLVVGKQIETGQRMAKEMAERDHLRYTQRLENDYYRYQDKLVDARDRLKKTEARFANTERTAKTTVSDADRWEADAARLATQGQYEDASDKAIDAINLINRRTDEFSPTGRQPLPHVERRKEGTRATTNYTNARGALAAACN
jgi:hypothetical protein